MVSLYVTIQDLIRVGLAQIPSAHAKSIILRWPGLRSKRAIVPPLSDAVSANFPLAFSIDSKAGGIHQNMKEIVAAGARLTTVARPFVDGGKKINGRKRHLLVDTQGLVLKAKVHSAAVMDRDGVESLLEQSIKNELPRMKHVWLDGGYKGEGKGKQWIEEHMGWRSRNLISTYRVPSPTGHSGSVWNLILRNVRRCVRCN